MGANEIVNFEELIMMALSNRELYGLQIAKAIEEVSNGEKKIGVGSLYPKLHKLEKKGYIESYWGDNRPKERNGARRKYYKLTGLGSNVLDEAQKFRINIANWQPVW